MYLSKQLLRCGTSIGVNINEAQESKYWIDLLVKTDEYTFKRYKHVKKLGWCNV